MFWAMLPDPVILKSYQQSETMMKYCIQFGIAAYIKIQLIYDVNQTSLIFKFDETSHYYISDEKQCDGCLDFWSNRHNIVSAPGDPVYSTLHKWSITRTLKLSYWKAEDVLYFLHTEMDFPNVNLAFDWKLKEHLERQLDATFHSLGTCSIHHVPESIWKGISALSFDLDGCFNNILFQIVVGTKTGLNVNLEIVTEKAAAYALEHTITRWLSTKYVLCEVFKTIDVTGRSIFLSFYKNKKGIFVRFLT